MIIPAQVKHLIAMALEEDLGRGDPTSFAVPKGLEANAKIIAREPLVVSCIWLIDAIVELSGCKLQVEDLATNGQKLCTEEVIANISGNARQLLGLERSILNFLQRTCGVATYASQYRSILAEAKNKNLKIVDTRKTIPGWRYLDKQAVRDGGLQNHRYGLDRGILIKEKHIRAAGGIKKAIDWLHQEIPHSLLLEVEVTSLIEAREAIAFGAEALLLDNFNAKDLLVVAKTLKVEAPHVLLEASGGVNLKNVHEYLDTGIDLISVGALTHSASAANLSLLFEVN